MQTVSNGYIRTHILDRTFIDKQGQRWIIDYKSSDKPQEVSLSDFLQEQMQEYAEQLSRYKFLFSEESNNGIKTALLFTSLSKLVEYD
jgi:ATP-dependent exoDNAse (exonuclease V) beta subunit